MGSGPNFTVIPNDWQNLEYIINDLCNRIIDEDASFTDYILKDGSRVFTATGAGFKDENDMTSDSAVAVASQQSIKAYVDTAISSFSSITLTGKLVAGSQASPIDVTATRQYGFELHYSGNNYNATAIRARAQAVTTDTAYQFQGGLFQAANNDNINVGVLNGLVAEAIGKATTNAATIAMMRGALIGAEWSAKDTITNLRTLHVRTHTRDSATEGYFSNSGYGIYMENEAVGGNGQALDAGIYFKGTNLSAGNKAFTHGMDFSGATYATADIKLSDNSVINDSSNYWGIGTASPKTKLHIMGGTDASLSDGSGYVVIGDQDGLNIVIDNNEIMARNNGAVANFNFQTDGGIFYVHFNTANDYQRFAVLENGDVGVGTKSPTEKLHVNSDVTNGGILIRSGTDDAKLTLNSPADENTIIALNVAGTDYWTMLRPANSDDFYLHSSYSGGFDALVADYQTGDTKIHGRVAFNGGALDNHMGIRSVFSYSGTGGQVGAKIQAVNTRNHVIKPAYIYGLSFDAQWVPTIGANAERKFGNMFGGNAAIAITLDASETQNYIIDNVYGYRSYAVVTGTAAGGVATMTTLNHFGAVNAGLAGNGAIGTQIGFYCPALSGATTNWGLAINTQSYINANLRIGGVTVPTNGLSMDVASKIDFRDNAIGMYSQADTFLDIFADGGLRIGDSSAGAPSNYTQISATGDITFGGSAGFYPVRIAQAAIPTPDTAELIVWRDTDDGKVYLVYNDTDSGVKSVEMT